MLKKNALKIKIECKYKVGKIFLFFMQFVLIINLHYRYC